MSEYSGFNLVNRNTLGPLLFVECRIAQVLRYVYECYKLTQKGSTFIYVCLC